MDTARMQRSFARVAENGDEVPLYFYSHLFLSPDPPPRMVPVAGRDRRMPL